MPRWKSPRSDGTLHLYHDDGPSVYDKGYVERLPRPDHQRPWRGVVFDMHGPRQDGYLFFDTVEDAKAWVEVIVRMTT